MAEVPALLLESVSRDYGDPPIRALNDVCFRVERGEWLAIEGPSGSGKSTLLNILGCLDRQTTGSYFFKGLDVGQLSDAERGGLRSRHIAFVFQSFHLLAHRSVVENVMLAEVYQHGTRRMRRERAQAVLERVGLSHRLDYLPTKLSGGERQRVAIARALLGSRHVLLCDEPTGNLDTTTSQSIMDLLASLHSEGLTIVMITHSPELAQAASRQVRIIDGELTEGSRSLAIQPPLIVEPRRPLFEFQQAYSNHVDLNSASKTELQQIPGIGPAIASRILDYRDKFGPAANCRSHLTIGDAGNVDLKVLMGRVEADLISAIRKSREKS